MHSRISAAFFVLLPFAAGVIDQLLCVALACPPTSAGLLLWRGSC